MFREKEVRAGMGLMDQADPDWDKRVDLAILSIQSPSRCALGQAFGSFFDGLKRLQIAHSSAASYGFSLPHYSYDVAEIVDTSRMFRLLDDTWIALIQERRSTARQGDGYGTTSEQVEERERELVLV